MTLLKPDDAWPLVAIMVAGTSLSIWLEHTYRWGAKLSAPVIALLLAMGLSNARVVPMEAPAYDFVGTWLVPIALPLLLIRADVRRIFRGTGRLMAAFHVASIGTVLGALLALWLLGSRIPEPVPVAGIMTGSYIGGMVNFMAISESLKTPGSVTSTLVVADNLVMAAVFLALLWIAGARACRHWLGGGHQPTTKADAGDAENAPAEPPGVRDLAAALTLATGVAGAAMFGQQVLTRHWPAPAADEWFTLMLRTLLTNRFVLITTLSLLVGTALARPLSRIRGAETIGAFLLYLYLFTIGLPADLTAVVTKSPLMFAFCGVMAGVNLGFTLAVGRLLRLPLEELLLAVNATLGGPPTAAAMAMSKEWSRLVLPALLAGIWGYVIATPIGLALVALLSR